MASIPRVVLDTNVVVSAGISTNGNPALILEMLIFEEIKNFTTSEITDEIKEVLQRPHLAKRMALAERELILGIFEKFSQTLEPTVKFNDVHDDPDDNKFLDCAVCASANYIISGDDHLLGLKEFRGIKIVSPAEFIGIMKKLRVENI